MACRFRLDNIWTYNGRQGCPERTIADQNKTDGRGNRAFSIIWAWMVLNLARVPRSDVVAARRQSVAILMPSSVLQAADCRRRHRIRALLSPPPPPSSSPLGALTTRHHSESPNSEDRRAPIAP